MVFGKIFNHVTLGDSLFDSTLKVDIWYKLLLFCLAMCGIALLLENSDDSHDILPSTGYANLWENLCLTCAARGENA